MLTPKQRVGAEASLLLTPKDMARLMASCRAAYHRPTGFAGTAAIRRVLASASRGFGS
jgi:hypothetical protein